MLESTKLRFVINRRIRESAGRVGEKRRSTAKLWRRIRRDPNSLAGRRLSIRSIINRVSSV